MCSTIFLETVVAVHIKKNKTKIVLKMPVNEVKLILDLIKSLMHEFHYNVIKLKYEDDIQICSNSTGSRIYQIKTEDFCKGIRGMINYFYTKDYL